MELWHGEYLNGKTAFDRGHFDRYRKNNMLRVEALERYKKGGRLLEVGCGNGYFLAAARDRGWQVQGVEVCGKLAAYIKKHLRLDIFAGTMEDAKFPDRSFDAVYLNNVIEHLNDPSSFMFEIGRALKDDGIVFISAPNMRDTLNIVNNVLARLGLRPNWEGYLRPPMHLHAFSPQPLDRLLDKTGFRVLDMFTAIQGDAVYFADFSPGSFKKLLKRAICIPTRSFDMGAQVIAYGAKRLSRSPEGLTGRCDDKT